MLVITEKRKILGQGKDLVRLARKMKAHGINIHMHSDVLDTAVSEIMKIDDEYVLFDHESTMKCIMDNQLLYGMDSLKEVYKETPVWQKVFDWGCQKRIDIISFNIDIYKIMAFAKRKDSLCNKAR